MNKLQEAGTRILLLLAVFIVVATSKMPDWALIASVCALAFGLLLWFVGDMVEMMAAIHGNSVQKHR